MVNNLLFKPLLFGAAFLFRPLRNAHIQRSDQRPEKDGHQERLEKSALPHGADNGNADGLGDPEEKECFSHEVVIFVDRKFLLSVPLPGALTPRFYPCIL